MQSLKKIICSLLCLLCLPLSACAPTEEIVAENDVYRILIKDGEFYMEMKNTDNPDSDGEAEAPPVIVFESLAEMKNDILTGQFTELEWREIERFRGGKIVNLDTLLKPIYPNSLNGYSVQWYGEIYSFRLKGPGAYQYSFYPMTEEDFNEAFNLRHERYLENAERVEIDPQTNGKIYINEMFNGDIWKNHLYTKEIDGRIFYIDELYVLDIDYMETFKEVPSNLYIYAPDSAGHYYGLHISTLDEIPSDEWLANFGFAPYVEDTSSP